VKKSENRSRGEKAGLRCGVQRDVVPPGSIARKERACREWTQYYQSPEKARAKIRRNDIKGKRVKLLL